VNFIFHEYVGGVAIFSQCVLFIELNAWDDECLVAIEVLQKQKKKGKKSKKKKNNLDFINTPMFANWMQIHMGKILKTIQVYHNDFIYVYLYIILFKIYIFETG
jgi:hypothetical protein